MTLLGVAATLATGCSDSAKPSAEPSAKVSASPKSPVQATASPKPHTLAFEITGEGRLSSLTYVVNGKETTKKSVRLPWRKTIHLPAKAGVDTWRLRTQGGSELVVKVDGERVADGYCTADSCRSDDSGSIED